MFIWGFSKDVANHELFRPTWCSVNAIGKHRVNKTSVQALVLCSNLYRAINFYDFTDFVRISNCSHGTVGKSTGLWGDRYWFESLSLPTFLNFINTTENRDTLFLCMKIFDTRTFFKYRRIPLRNFSVLWDKKFSTENRDIPHFCIKYRNQWWYWCLQKTFEN